MAFVEELSTLSMERVFARAEEMGKWERERLARWLSYVAMALRDMLVLHEDGGSTILYNKDVRARLVTLLARFPKGRLFALLSLVRETQRRMQANVSLRLLMEGFD